MKFDLVQLRSRVHAFESSHAPSEELEAQAAKLIASHFTAEGYTVERVTVAGFRKLVCARGVVTSAAFVGLLFSSAWLAVLGKPFVVRAIIDLLAICSRFAVPRFFDRVEQRFAPRVSTENILASRPSAHIAEVRVVFLSELSARPTVVRSKWAWTIWLAAGLGATALFLISFGLDVPIQGLAILGIVVLLLSVAGRMAYLSPRQVHSHPDGLAALIELAKNWPKSKDKHVETRFVAVGGRDLGAAGVRALVASIRNEWPKKPTLVIGIRQPSIGPGLTLATTLTTDTLAFDAAKSLWIPHEPNIDNSVWMDLPILRAPEFIGIFGDHNWDQSPGMDLEAMRRAMQLASEIALRWAKSSAAGEDRQETRNTAR